VPGFFSAGADINMLKASKPDYKAMFCLHCQETLNLFASTPKVVIAAINGHCVGGGLEIALSCDLRMMAKDSGKIGLPEVTLGVLPGTGGLTRVVDKRKVRRDLADLFSTNPDGVKADRARAWGLVDEIAPPAQFRKLVEERAGKLAASSPRPAEAKGIKLNPIKRKIEDEGYHYTHVDVAFDRNARTATLTVRAPGGTQPRSVEEIHAAGDTWWPLAMARELDDAILMLRTNELELGLLLLKTEGNAETVLSADTLLLKNRKDWLVRETIGLLRRTLARLDVTSRSMFAVIEAGSCFAGTLFEMALAADRSYMLASEEGEAAKIALSGMNFGLLPMVNGRSRLGTRFNDDVKKLAELENYSGNLLGADEALKLGLVTVAPDDLDWEDELRIAIEERASLSPDALTGMEANLRFPGPETTETKVFGRLSAWQNWIFIRPNATGEQGALKIYGKGSKAKFDWERV
jgi:benzoyl-CoA-dihydrodiol lyase